jgi:hypothetical protein
VPARRRPARPVEIVLTEEDLAAIQRASAVDVGGRAAEGEEPAAVPAAAAAPAAGAPADAYEPIGSRVWRFDGQAPGAVGETIRRILAATTLPRRKRRDGGEE